MTKRWSDNVVPPFPHRGVHLMYCHSDNPKAPTSYEELLLKFLFRNNFVVHGSMLLEKPDTKMCADLLYGFSNQCHSIRKVITTSFIYHLQFFNHPHYAANFTNIIGCHVP